MHDQYQYGLHYLTLRASQKSAQIKISQHYLNGYNNQLLPLNILMTNIPIAIVYAAQREE